MVEKKNSFKDRNRSGASERVREKQDLSPDQITPMDKRKDEVIDFFSEHESSVLVAHTGAGKTTRAPDFLFKALGPDSCIAVTVPRVNIATSISEYVAELNGYDKEVGYQVRFEDTTDEDTNLNFMTDGIMLRKIISDPLLKGYDAVMVDEAHERSLNIDIVMGLLKQAQELRKEKGYKPLKVVISSATIEKEKFAKYFGTEAVKEVEGKMFPVEEHYLEMPVDNYMDAASEKCNKIVASGDSGDILVFMPGRDEIEGTISRLKKTDAGNQCEVLELHASVSKEEQKKAITKRGDRRRIIVSTNIAEAGVTVDGVRHVVDSGLIKETGFDPEVNIRKLETKEHSQAGLQQRRGRAGRLTDGVYHALYTRKSFERRPAYSTPEIQRTNLANLVLIMKKSGIDKVESFDFIDKPDSESIISAVQELKMLGALDEQEFITPVGETMADLPLEPRVARMVVEGLDRGCVGDVVTIAAFFNERRKLFVRPKGKEFEADEVHDRFTDDQSDFMTFLNIWKEYEKFSGNRFRWARDNFLNAQTLDRVRQTRMQILRVLRNGHTYDERSDDPEEIGKSIFAGLLSNFVYKSGRHVYSFVHSRSGHSSLEDDKFIHPSSSVFQSSPKLCTVGEVFSVDSSRRGKKTWISPVQTVKPEWVSEIAPHLLEVRSEELKYDPEQDGVYRNTVRRLKDTRYLDDFPPELERVDSDDAVEVFSEYLANHHDFADFSVNNQEVMNQYNDLYLRNGGDISENPLFEGKFSTDMLRTFYTLGLARAGNASSIRDLEDRGVDLSFSLEDFVPLEVQRKIREENPDTITAEGSVYPVMYLTTYRNEFHARIVMDDEEALLLDTIPSLPSGRKVHVFAKGSSHGQVFNDIESLKQEVENRLNNDLWDSWKRKNPDLHTQPQDVSDLLSSGVSLPEPVVYGKIIATGDSLFAYPALVPKRWDEGFCIVYLRDKNEAATKHAETVESFESRREYFMKKQAEKQEIDSMQEEVEALSGTDIEIYKQRADNQDLLYNFLDAVRETKNFLYRKVPDSARTGIKRASDYLAEIKKEEQKYMDSDASIREVVHGGLLEELRTVLGVYADIEGIKSGRVTVSPDVFKRIDFADDNQVIVSEVVAEDDSGSNYTVVQVAVDRSGRVLLADDSEKMTLEGDDLVWNDGVANKVWVEDYEVFYSDEEFRRREQGVPDDSYFEGRSVEDLEDEYSNADSSEYKEVARRHLIFALEEKIRSSDMPFEIAVLQAKLKDFQKG